MYTTLTAILLFLTNNNLWCAAYPTVVVFGETDGTRFVTKKYFSFFKSDFVLLYKSLITICHTIAQNSVTNNLQDTKGIILSRYDAIYAWCACTVDSKLHVSFTIELSLETVYKVTFSLEDFNDLIFIFSKLLIPSLCLESNITNSLHRACTYSLNELKSLNTMEDCEAFVKKHNLDEKCNIYLMYYKEIIIIVHKLISLYNPQIKINLIEDILNFKP